MYLVDTNVFSELRKSDRGTCHPAVAFWIRSVKPEQLFLSVITVMEMEVGYLRLLRHDERQAKLLKAWLSSAVFSVFSERVLPVDEVVALTCAALHVPDKRPESDALIAATALHHDLILVTRNIRDFQGTGVRLINPWENPAE